MARFIRGKLLLTAGAIAIAVIFTLVWFQPQKLLIDQEVDEALPGRSADAAAADADEKQASDSKSTSEAKPIETVGAGNFRALAHSVSGRARLLELRNGDLYLRFENFKVENGPDLRVYVSQAKATSDADAFSRDSIDLGALKGNVGDQNYRVPAGATRGALTSAVIWCRRFSVGFAVAPLAPGGG